LTIGSKTNAGHTDMKFFMRVLIAALIAATVLPPAAYAQQPRSPPVPMSDEQKARIREKETYQKDTDAAYKSTLKRIPDAKQNVDPWGNLRTPAEPPRDK